MNSNFLKTIALMIVLQFCTVSIIASKLKPTSLFSSKNDTVLWMNAKTKHFPKEGWAFSKGELKLEAGKKGGDLMTRKKYSNFELELEFKMTRLVNSGVKYFMNHIENITKGRKEWVGFEYQIIDDFNGSEIRGYEGPKGSTGALYLICEPDSNQKKLKPVGKWNHLKIVVKDNHVEHWLNHKKVVDVKIDTKEFRDAVKETKFVDYPDFGFMKDGYILLQDHGNEVSFRKIKLLDLTK